MPVKHLGCSSSEVSASRLPSRMLDVHSGRELMEALSLQPRVVYRLPPPQKALRTGHQASVPVGAARASASVSSTDLSGFPAPSTSMAIKTEHRPRCAPACP
ncbi:hypothetical protein CesoFtcFv8_013273 [Champsocephalus esox]|uniref:Uncharacterized protein n=1 Tax=Champsocephalus esox TaxID=159716 RepID=A0AAN8BWX4_9TELE|nr:hypothetical protein CesoFtcFv8_013273 [Champsocephalus esox]